MARLGWVLLLTCWLPVQAQQPDSSLIAELLERHEAAWLVESAQEVIPLALAEGRFARVDSVIAAVDAYMTAEPDGRTPWLSEQHRFLVDLVQGEVGALDALRNDGPWLRPAWYWEVAPWSYRGSPEPRGFEPLRWSAPDDTTALRPRYFAGRPASWFWPPSRYSQAVTLQYRHAMPRLEAAGADAETLDFADLLMEYLMRAPRTVIPYHGYTLLGVGAWNTPDDRGRRFLNERADEFLARYPSSRFEQFVRSVIRVRHERGGLGISFAVGVGPGTVDSAEPFGSGFQAHFALDVLTKYARIGLMLSGGALDVESPFVVNGEEWLPGRQTTVTYGGIEVGPHLNFRYVAADVFVGASLLRVRSFEGDDTSPSVSTPLAPAFTYGAQVDVYPFGGTYGGVALRGRYAAARPRFSDTYDPNFGAEYRLFSFGILWTRWLPVRNY